MGVLARPNPLKASSSITVAPTVGCLMSSVALILDFLPTTLSNRRDSKIVATTLPVDLATLPRLPMDQVQYLAKPVLDQALQPTILRVKVVTEALRAKASKAITDILVKWVNRCMDSNRTMAPGSLDSVNTRAEHKATRVLAMVVHTAHTVPDSVATTTGIVAVVDGAEAMATKTLFHVFPYSRLTEVPSYISRDLRRLRRKG